MPSERQMPAASVSAGVAWLPAKTLIHSRWGAIARRSSRVSSSWLQVIDSCLK
jgi:hypothetical protein